MEKLEHSNRRDQRVTSSESGRSYRFVPGFEVPTILLRRPADGSSCQGEGLMRPVLQIESAN